MVAESDYQAALEALQRPLAPQVKIPSTNKDPSQAEPDIRAIQEAALLLQDACRTSLCQNLQRVVQPLSDEAYHTYVYQLTKGEDEELDNLNGLDQPVDNSTDDDDVLFDDEDLLDTQCLKNVQALRAQVREQAQRVKALQTSVLQHSVDLAARQVQVWNTTKEFDANKSMGTDEDAVDNQPCHSLLEEMEASLQEMTAALQTAQTQVPTKLATLRETIAVIEKAKDMNGGKHAPNPIEEAIVRPDNEGDDVPSLGGKGNFSTAGLPPQERLANLLRG